jgi:4-hydroxybenzoate polyprenyltransferase
VKKIQMPPLLRAMRPQQWVKNLFVLAPVVFAHRLTDPSSLGRALLALAAFCAGSSAIYLLNDVRDREADRNHPLKRQRAIASGQVSVTAALAVAAALTAAAVAAAAALGRLTLILLVAYLLLNALYTWQLKHVVILDVMVLAVGYLLRVEAGGAAVGVAVSSWLLLCTLFVAIFLGFSKRRHELLLLADRAADQRRVLSHYSPAFLDQMISVVTASTLMAYIVYCTSSDTVERFGTHLLVLTVPFPIYGILRYLYLVHRKDGGGNPSELLITDRPLLVCVGLWGLVTALVIYRPFGS